MNCKHRWKETIEKEHPLHKGQTVWQCVNCGIVQPWKPDEGEEIKRLEQPAQFLMDAGLLFEINCRILHPLGLALEVFFDEDADEWKLGGIWDYREDPEGIMYDDDTLKAGLTKYEKFYNEVAKEAHQKRFEKLGYIVQVGYDRKDVEWAKK